MSSSFFSKHPFDSTDETEPLYTRLPPNMPVASAVLGNYGRVRLDNENLEADHTEIIDKVTYQYKHEHKLLSVLSQNANYPSSRFVYDDSSSAWWGTVTEQVAVHESRPHRLDNLGPTPWVTDWCTWLDLEAIYPGVPIDETRPHKKHGRVPTTPFHDIGPLRLTRDGCVIANDYYFLPDEEIEETRIENVCIFRGKKTRKKFYAPETYPLLQIVDLNSGKNLFFGYVRGWWY